MLAEHDDVQQMVTVYLPVTYAAIEAFVRFVLIVFQSSHWVLFLRICESGGTSSDKDSDAASEVFGLLLNTDVKAQSLQADGIKIGGWAIDKDETALEDIEDDDRSLNSTNKVDTKLNGWIKEHNEDYADVIDDEYISSNFKLEIKSPKTERIKCKRCPRLFAYTAALNKHIQKHKEEDEEDNDAEAPETQYHCEMGCANEGYQLKRKGSLIRIVIREKNRIMWEKFSN